MTAPTPEQAPPRHNPWLVLTVLCLGFFMILLDTTIVNIAIPDMSGDLSASLDQILWVVNSYVLIYAVLLITAGRLGDLYGPKRLFILGLIVFTLASAACGFAATPEQLIIARVVQGAGGALLTPQTLSVITMIFPPEKRGAAFGLWGAVAGVATVAGPTLGGYLVTDWGWEYIFFVNVPIGIVTIVLAAIVMPSLHLGRQHKLDWIGTLLASVGLFLLTFGLIEGEPHDWGRVWGPVTIVEVIVAGAAVLVAFMWHQYATRAGEPLIPFAIFSDRNYSLMNFVSAAIAFGMLALFLPLVIYLQSVLGLTALQAGVATAPMSLISMFVAPVAGRLADRTGGKWILFIGLTLWSTGMGLVVWLAQVGTGQWHILPGLLVAGVGLGMTFAPLQTIAMRNIEPRMAGSASGFINTARQLGAVIGSAAVGAVLQVQLADQLRSTARDTAQDLPAPLREHFINGFSHVKGGSLDIGAGASAVPIPPDVPPAARQPIMDAATRTFDEAFTTAMKHSLVLPLAVLAVAALGCLLIQSRRVAAEARSRPAGTGPDGPNTGEPVATARA